MDISDPFPTLPSLTAFSPASTFLLTAHASHLIIRQTNTLQIGRIFDLPPPAASPPTKPTTSRSRTALAGAQITDIGWSPDSAYVFAARRREGKVWVFAVEGEGREQEPVAVVEAGVEGLAGAKWGAGEREIMCWSEYGLRLSIHTLSPHRHTTVIQYPAHPLASPYLPPDSRYLLLLERHRAKDYLGIYDSSSLYTIERHLALPATTPSQILPSPAGSHIAVIESILQYKLHILTPTGTLLTTFPSPPLSDGAEFAGLGIRSAAWHPSGSFLALGGWDGKIRILESTAWTQIAVFNPVTRIASPSVKIYREPLQWLAQTRGTAIVPFDRLTPPHTLPFHRPDASKANPKSGAQALHWTPDGSHLLALDESLPNTCQIYSFLSASSPSSSSPTLSPRLETIIHLTHPIRSLSLSPLPIPGGSFKLALSSAGPPAVYLFSPDTGAEAVGLPSRSFPFTSPVSVEYGADGRPLLIHSSAAERFCVAFSASEGDPDGEGEGHDFSRALEEEDIWGL